MRSFHTWTHVCARPGSGSLAGLAWLGFAERQTHTLSRWGEVWSCCVGASTRSPHATPISRPLPNPHTNPTIFFLMWLILRLRNTQKQPNKPTPQLDRVSNTISTFSVCVSYCHNSKCVCVCVPLTPTFVCSSCSHLSQGQAFEEA